MRKKTHRKRPMDAETRKTKVKEVAKRVVLDGEKMASIASSENLSVSQVHRLYRLAKDLGIVQVSIDEDGEARPGRCADLEVEMRRLYDLEDVLVVDTGYEGGFDAIEDDKLHKKLGQTLGERLRDEFRSNDVIGVTGGRGTNMCALAVRGRNSPPLGARNVTIVALGGRVSATEWLDKKPLDANWVAYQLSLCFKSPRIEYLSLPVAVPSAKTARELLEDGSGKLIAGSHWRSENGLVPSVALVGIGSIDGGHPFLKYSDGFELESIRIDLKKLEEEIIRFRSKTGYSPVWDIGYRLFCDPASPAAIKKIVDDLNSRILAVNEEQLRMIDRVYGIGGGPIKYMAIKHFLSARQPLIHILCTDRLTALRLVKERQ